MNYATAAEVNKIVESYRSDTVRFLQKLVRIIKESGFKLPGEDPKKFEKHVENRFRRIKGDGTFRIEWMPRLLPAGEVAVDHPFVKCAAGSYRKAVGRKPALTGAFMSDMGMMIKYGGFPCINFGPSRRWGREGMAHQPDEFVEN